jgi:hypothetical protein
MSPANYAMAEASMNIYELFIETRVINTDTCKAVPKINKVIRDLNKTTLYGLTNLPPEFQWSGNIQQVTAAINERLLLSISKSMERTPTESM